MPRSLDLFASVPSTPAYGLGQKLRAGYHAAALEIAGPLFFGAAQRALSAFDRVSGNRDAGHPQSVILHLAQVPASDATGLAALETSVANLKQSGNNVILAGMCPEVAGVVARAGLVPGRGRLAIAPDLDTAVSLALLHSARQPPAAAPATGARA